MQLDHTTQHHYLDQEVFQNNEKIADELVAAAVAIKKARKKEKFGTPGRILPLHPTTNISTAQKCWRVCDRCKRIARSILRAFILQLENMNFETPSEAEVMSLLVHNMKRRQNAPHTRRGVPSGG